MNQKDGKSAWGSAVSMEKRELFEERAETILLILKQRFPGIPQSSLDISKIQYNRDVGQAVLESYSRILESLAFTVLSRIEDVLYADFATRNPSEAIFKRNSIRDISQFTAPDTLTSPTGELEKQSSLEGMTLLDFMGWEANQAENKGKKESEEEEEEENIDDQPKVQVKAPPKLTTIRTRRISYLETLGGLRSPTARH